MQRKLDFKLPKHTQLTPWGQVVLLGWFAAAIGLAMLTFPLALRGHGAVPAGYLGLYIFVFVTLAQIPLSAVLNRYFTYEARHRRLDEAVNKIRRN
jgi:hypothetical protein